LATYAILRPSPGGDAEAGVDKVTACLQLAAGFDEYPLLFAGDEVLGHRLTNCDHAKKEASFQPDGSPYHPATNSFTFAYGFCAIEQGQNSCRVPVTLIVYPSCASEYAAVDSGVEIRGAAAFIEDSGNIRIVQPTHMLTVSAPGSIVAERSANAAAIVEALVPANDLARALTPGAPLTTPLEPSKVCP